MLIVIVKLARLGIPKVGQTAKFLTLSLIKLKICDVVNRTGKPDVVIGQIRNNPDVVIGHTGKPDVVIGQIKNNPDVVIGQTGKS